MYHEALLLLQPPLVVLHLLLLHHQPLLHHSLAAILHDDRARTAAELLGEAFKRSHQSGAFYVRCSDLHVGAPQGRVLRSVLTPGIGRAVAASPNSSSDAGVDRRLQSRWTSDSFQKKVFDSHPKTCLLQRHDHSITAYSQLRPSQMFTRIWREQHLHWDTEVIFT